MVVVFSAISWGKVGFVTEKDSTENQILFVLNIT